MVFPWFAYGGLAAASLGIDLQQISECHRLMEASLRRELTDFEQRINRQAEGMTDSQKQEFYEFHADSHWEFSEAFPAIFRSSLFVSTYALLEARLDDLCHDMQRKNKCELVLSDIHGKGIRRAQTYLKKVARVPFPDEKWGAVMLLSRVRNVLVHADGWLKEDETGHSVKAFAEANPKLIGINATRKIVLQEDFVPHALSAVRGFFEALYSTLHRS